MSMTQLKKCDFPGCTNEFPEHHTANVCNAKHVFLGGTCGNNNWRNGLITRLVEREVPAGYLFDPVVEDWNDEAQRNEDTAKSQANYMLYYLGDPQMDANHVSYYSLLEATMGLYDAENSTVVVFGKAGMPDHARKASDKACKDLKIRFPDAPIFGTLTEAEDWLVERLAP